MLTIYRRHRKNCKQRAKGRKYRHCQCPIWVDGLLDGKEMRESLKLRDWQRAQDLIREWEAEDRRIVRHEHQVTIKDAHAKFTADAEARKLNDATLYKYRLLFRQLDGFAETYKLHFLKQLDLDMLATFRTTWTEGPRTSLKKLERLRAFMRFAEKRKWIDDNPATELKAPKVPNKPTMPFTREEMIRIPQSASCSGWASSVIIGPALSSSSRPNHIGTVASTLGSSTGWLLRSRANANRFFSVNQKA